MTGTQSSGDVYTKLTRIAELARKYRGQALKTLSHQIDREFLREAYRRTRKDGATGIDQQTAAMYAEDLETNLESLENRFKSGRYWAPPVRRSYIPKPDGTERPLGIPTFEDKVLQRVGVLRVRASMFRFRPRNERRTCGTRAENPRGVEKPNREGVTLQGPYKVLQGPRFIAAPPATPTIFSIFHSAFSIQHSLEGS